MRANFNRVTWTAELDNEAVKAIRFVNGWNTDLRVSLTGIDKNMLFDWICNNEIGLFGIAISPHPEVISDEYNNYEQMIWDVVRQVVR